MSNVASDLVKEYSPSLNTKRFQSYDQPNEQVVKHFVEFTTNDTLVARQKYHVKHDVRYGGNNDNQLLDIYYKQCETQTPLFVFIHGGYWQALTKDSSGPFITPLLENGFRVVAVEYNLCPNVRLEQQVTQMHNFFVWLFNYAQETKASNISICGHSAGAHLAMSCFKNNMLFMPGAELVARFFLISGVYDLQKLWNLECTNPNNILALSEQKAYDLSPLFWNITPELIELINQRNIEMHLLAAENDSETFKAQTSDLHHKFKEANWNPNNLKFHIFNDYDHFDIIEDMSKSGSAINCYIMENLKVLNRE